MVDRNIGYGNGDSRNADGWYGDGDAVGVSLRAEAAGALRYLNQHIRALGLPAITPNEGMRSIAMQEYYWDLYRSGRGNLAGFPGTSIHGWGLAVDLEPPYDSPGPRHSVLVAAAPAFGWWHAGATFSQYEGWHFEYDGRNVSDEMAAEFRRAGMRGATLGSQRGWFGMASDEQIDKMLQSIDQMRWMMEKSLAPAAGRSDQAAWTVMNTVAPTLRDLSGALKALDQKLQPVLERNDKASWTTLHVVGPLVRELDKRVAGLEKSQPGQ